MAKNSGLLKANKAKKDEFYTQLTDIELEMKHYRTFFADKIVFCNCDDPEESAFYQYFEMNFSFLGLKKLVTTHYDEFEPTYKLELTQADNTNGYISNKTPLNGNGDFRNQECIDILKECDVVVTNPPFSLWRDFLAQLIEYNKKFIIIGNMNAIIYKDVFPLLKENKMWIGASIHSGDREFRVPDDYPLDASGVRIDENGVKYIRVKGVRWYTNIDHNQRHEDLVCFKTYNPTDYPMLLNYDAIRVRSVNDIPCDYDGEMAVPINFMDKFNPEEFELIGCNSTLARAMDEIREHCPKRSGSDAFYLKTPEGEYKRLFSQVVIKRR